jgi:hypothetical protein
MKSEFINYCTSIGMAEPLVVAVATLHDECSLMTADAIDAIFINEHIDGSGNRVYETLHFLTKRTIF